MPSPLEEKAAHQRLSLAQTEYRLARETQEYRKASYQAKKASYERAQTEYRLAKEKYEAKKASYEKRKAEYDDLMRKEGKEGKEPKEPKEGKEGHHHAAQKKPAVHRHRHPPEQRMFVLEPVEAAIVGRNSK